MEYYKLYPTFLMLRLMEKCNNKCSFCMVSEEIKENNKIFPIKEIKDIITSLPKGVEIDFFGGEPSLHSYFWELLKHSIENSRNCSIESNLRIFSNKRLANKLNEIGGRKIRIQTSIHGHTSDLHNSITCSKNSYQQTIHAIKNLRNHDIHITTNIVLTSKIEGKLLEIFQNLEKVNIKSYKVSLLVNVKGSEHLIPNYNIIKKELNVVTAWCKEREYQLRIEKAPLCLNPENIDLFQYEKLYLFNDRIFLKGCNECLLKNRCNGIDESYLKKEDSISIEPITEIDDSQITAIDKNKLDNFEPKKNLLTLIKWPIKDETNMKTLLKLKNIRDKAVRNNGDIVFVDNSIASP